MRKVEKSKNALLQTYIQFFFFLIEDTSIILARTVPPEFQDKLNLLRASMTRRYFQYFSILQQIQIESISDEDLEVSITHLDNLSEDFPVCFEDLAKMHVRERIPTPFEVETGNANFALHLQKEFTDTTMDLEIGPH